MNDNKQKLLKMLGILIGLVVIVWCITIFTKGSTKSLSDYANENPQLQNKTEESNQSADNASTDIDHPSDTNQNDTNLTDDKATDDKATNDDISNDEFVDGASSNGSANATYKEAETDLIGASLNKDTLLDQRVTYTDSFYYEPLSDNLRRYITGISYPAKNEDNTEIQITYDSLAYLHILYCDFEGNSAEGELICNKEIAQDLVEIFYELYLNEYAIERVRLIDEYDGDDTASMEDNNTSCFNYRPVSNSDSLSKHAYGLAIDINPLYNPYVTYNKDHTENISPVAGAAYADRSSSFPYKIDENDLCYKLFTQHGFIWGGNWNTLKDYQHFQKALDKQLCSESLLLEAFENCSQKVHKKRD